MWERKISPEKQSITHNIFKPLLRRYHTQSNTIRITFNPRYTDQIGIQAISKTSLSFLLDISFDFHRTYWFKYIRCKSTSSTITSINDKTL
jgi:hypothetical protein